MGVRKLIFAEVEECVMVQEQGKAMVAGCLLQPAEEHEECAFAGAQFA